MPNSNVSTTPSNTSEDQSVSSPPQIFNRFFIDKPVIGLTGGIGSGKTAVSDWFATQGVDVVDADVVAHDIMKKGSPTLNELAQALGDWVIDDAGNMDRQAVREHVFANDDSLLKLEAITHPAIRQQIKKQLTESQSKYVILSAPLLLESAAGGLASLCDRVLVVDVSEAIQLDRASARDTQSMDKIKAIMNNQLSRKARLEHADDIIDNSGSLEALYEQLKPLHQKYLTLKKKI